MVTFREINGDNFQECFNLKVADSQKNFVASNIYSLAQAWVFPKAAMPFAIYSGDTMVGFVMMNYDDEDNTYGIWRFMIDERYQRKGYGKAALQLAIAYLRDKFKATEIYLSFEPENTVAERLYSSAGFRPTGEVDDGEVVMCLKIDK